MSMCYYFVVINKFDLGNEVVKFNVHHYAEWPKQIQFQLGILYLDETLINDKPTTITKT